MSQAPSMPMYWDAYLADTTHLTAEEHGAYLLLLAAMWRRNGWVPDDDKDNARIIGLTVAKWRKIKARLEPFLTFEDNQITQKNLLKIWKNTQEKIAKNKSNGALGGRPKSNKNKHLEKANGFVSDNPNKTIPEPEPEPKDKAKASSSGDGFRWKYFDRSNPEHLDRLQSVLLEAGRPSLNEAGGGFLTLAEPLRWLEAGADVDLHILPVIRGICARKTGLKSWNYFTNAILDAVAKPPLQPVAAGAGKPAIDPEVADFMSKFEVAQ